MGAAATLAARPATALGPSTTRRRASPAITWAAPGGAGPATKNITILSVVADRTTSTPAILPIRSSRPRPRNRRSWRRCSRLSASENARAGEARPAAATADLADESSPSRRSNPSPRSRRPTRTVDDHPGFKTSTSVTLHRFGTDPAYDDWRTDGSRLQEELTAPVGFRTRRPEFSGSVQTPAAVSMALDMEATGSHPGPDRHYPDRRCSRCLLRAQHNAALWRGADRRHPRCRDRGRGRGTGRLENVRRDPRPSQPPPRREESDASAGRDRWPASRILS